MSLHSWISRFVTWGLVLTGANALAVEPGWGSLEKNFRELPPEARRLTGPLFWLHGDESKERLEMYVGKVAEGGNGCFTAESRPHSDWLGQGWYRDLGICLDAAKKNDLQMWIFDEKWWPSGEVGGIVPERYASKRLITSSADFQGPGRFSAQALSAPERFIGAVAARPGNGGLLGDSLIDLSRNIVDGKLQWDAPAGSWRILQFAWEPRKSGHRYLVDGASRDCVDWYINTVYQPHYDHFKADFGKTIRGYFYDEPETHGDWGTEVMQVLAERKIDWKQALVAWKFSLAGEEQAAARYQYQDALAEAWGRTLYGGITEWCRAHKVRSIGHFLEHGNEYLHQELCAGNMFQLQKYSDMGAIDAVFAQFRWGSRVPGDVTWQTPKLGSSISHAYGKEDDVAMVEIFGARGQDLTYPEMKWWADAMQVAGINFLIPHSFNPRSPNDTDCPPYFYNGGFEPRWPLYRVFADYTSRLSELLSGGRHVCPVALLFLGGSAHVGQRIQPEQISEALQDALYDCDWLPYDVFERDMQIAGKGLRLRQENYRVLVVPPVEVIPYATLAKVKAYFDAGGVVVAHGFLPSKSATLGRTSSDIAALTGAIWGTPEPGLGVCRTNTKGGRAYLLPAAPTPAQLQQVLAGDARVHPTLEVVKGDTGGWVHVLHRVKSGRDVFFIANQNLSPEPRPLKLRVQAAGVPECWDPMRNEITSVPFQRQGETVELSLTFEPNESALLVFAPKARPLPARREANAHLLAEYPLERAKAVTQAPTLQPQKTPAGRLEGASWVWYPEGDATQSVPPGRRFFRKQITVPAGKAIQQATFFGTADNGFKLYINGELAGHGDDSQDGWRNPAELEVTGKLKPGLNQLAIAAENTTDKPGPAGVIGVLSIRFTDGEPLVIRVDDSWKTAQQPAEGWLLAGFDDSGWVSAKVAAEFGGGPWGRLGQAGGQRTHSPVKEADVFLGKVMLAAGTDLKHSRVYLEMDSLVPEAAARVSANGKYIGGLIGKPFRLDVTDSVKAGENEFRIEPFAPRKVVLKIVKP